MRLFVKKHSEYSSAQMIKKYDLSIYPRDLFVSVGFDEEELRSSFIDSDDKALSFEDCDIDMIDCLTCSIVQEVKSKNYGVLVIIKEPEDISVLVHESVHAANAICEQLGLNPETSNDECYCYLVQFIFKCINEAVYGKDTHNT